MTAKEFYTLLLRYGCEPVSVRGSHFKLRNPKTGSVTTVPIHSGIVLGKGLLASVLKQLGIDPADFLAFKEQK
jgi:predicted RNA binding protein YcfA (HicA-like mRNA interferase family)